MSEPQVLRQTTFKRNGHANFFLRCLQALPASGTSQDANRITIAYFCLSGLDLLGVLDEKTTLEQRNGWVQWIWKLQAPSGGFRGSTFMTTPNSSTSPAHLPSTYTALLCLAILKAPLDRLNVPGLTTFLKSCQNRDGTFSPLPRAATQDVDERGDFQSDLRMTYCACAISSMIGDSSALDALLATQVIRQCKTWEGGYAARPAGMSSKSGLSPGEAQGGTTYCALASLHLLGTKSLKDPRNRLDEHYDTLRWLLQRQLGGFQGRPGKNEDVCYSFWCGGALTMLSQADLINAQADRAFLLRAQYPFGGFGKEPEDTPDPYHSYLAIAALSMHEHRDQTRDSDLGLGKLDPAWNVRTETADWLRGEVARIKGKIP